MNRVPGMRWQQHVKIDAVRFSSAFIYDRMKRANIMGDDWAAGSFPLQQKKNIFGTYETMSAVDFQRCIMLVPICRVNSFFVRTIEVIP